MSTLEERVGVLEGSMKEQGAHIVGLRADVADLRADLRSETGQLRGEMGQLRGEMGQLRDEMGRRFDAVDRRFEAIRAEMSRYFTWLVGLVMTMTVAIIAAIVNFR